MALCRNIKKEQGEKGEREKNKVRERLDQHRGAERERWMKSRMVEESEG